jgi:hypothetical protein
MPSLVAIFEIVALQFQRIIASARSMFCPFVDVNGRPCLSPSWTLVRLLLNISFHSYTCHCDKQLRPYLAANCRWISDPFIPSDSKKRIIACCLSLVQTSSGPVIFMLCSTDKNKQLNHTRSIPPSDITVPYSFKKSSLEHASCFVLFCGCRWAFKPVCIINTDSVTFKHFDPLVVIFMPWSLGKNGQLNHTRSMSPSGIELQHEHASAVLPIIKRKYLSTALTIWTSFVTTISLL